MTDKANKTQAIINGVIASVIGAGAGFGVQFTPAHNDGDQEIAELRREFDDHKFQMQRALDRRDQELARYKQNIKTAFYTGDTYFLSDDVPPPAAAMEAAPEFVIEDDAIEEPRE